MAQKNKKLDEMTKAERSDFYAWRTEKMKLQRAKIEQQKFFIDDDIEAFTKKTIINDRLNGANDIPIIEWVKEKMYAGMDPEKIRRDIGITNGYKDKRWQRLIRQIRDTVINEDLVVNTVKRTNEAFDALEWLNDTLKKDFVECTDKDTKIKFAGEIRKNCMDAAALGHGIIKLGMELGSIIPGEEARRSAQPIVIINNNIPRPSLDPANAPVIEVHKSGTVQKYELEDGDSASV